MNKDYIIVDEDVRAIMRREFFDAIGLSPT